MFRNEASLTERYDTVFTPKVVEKIRKGSPPRCSAGMARECSATVSSGRRPRREARWRQCSTHDRDRALRPRARASVLGALHRPAARGTPRASAGLVGNHATRCRRTGGSGRDRRRRPRRRAGGLVHPHVRLRRPRDAGADGSPRRPWWPAVPRCGTPCTWGPDWRSVAPRSSIDRRKSWPAPAVPVRHASLRGAVRRADLEGLFGDDYRATGVRSGVGCHARVSPPRLLFRDPSARRSTRSSTRPPSSEPSA